MTLMWVKNISLLPCFKMVPTAAAPGMGFPGGAVVRNLPANAADARDPVQSLGQENLLKQEVATPSSILPWKIPWTEEPGGLQPMG